MAAFTLMRADGDDGVWPRASALLAVIAGVSTAAGLLALKIDLIFVHGVACAVAVLTYSFNERPWRAQPEAAEGRPAGFVVLSWALAYLASLHLLLALQRQAGLNEFVALGLAGATFMLVAWCCAALERLAAKWPATSWLSRAFVGHLVLAATIAALLVSDVRPLYRLWSTIDMRAAAPTLGRVPVWI